MRPEIRRDKDHRYYVGDDPDFYPSVTTILGATLPKNGLDWYGFKLACEGLQACTIESLQSRRSIPGGYMALLKETHASPNHALHKAMERGARIHGALEHYIRTGEIISPSAFPREYHHQIGSLARWLIDNEPEFLGTEVLTCSLEHRYAGTLDIRCRIKDKLYLIDLKTGAKAYPDTYYPQLIAYEHAEVELGEPPSDILAVLHLPQEGEAKLVEIPDNWGWEDFKVLLDCYKQAQSRKARKVTV